MERQSQGSTSLTPRPSAEWRLAPDDPRTVGGWIAGKPHARGLFLATAVTLAFAGVTLTVAWITRQPPVLLFAPALASLAVAGGFGWVRFSKAHAALPTYTQAPDAIPVAVLLRHHGRHLGQDFGWIDFEGGWLVYEGLRMDFALKDSDLTSRVLHERGVELNLKGGGQAFVRPLGSPTDPHLAREESTRFTQAIRDWLRGPAPEGESVFPPTVPHPLHRAPFLAPLFAIDIMLDLMGALGLLIGSLAFSLLLFVPALVGLVGVGLGVVRLRQGLTRLSSPKSPVLANPKSKIVDP